MPRSPEMSALAVVGWASVVVLSALGIVLVTNVSVTRRFGSAPEPAAWPRVSICVPARNEERHIAECVATLSAQDYPDFEVLVCDDESTDATREILVRLAETDARLTVIDGPPLPSGWVGKNHALHVLARRAIGELLLFVDADARLHPRCLRDAVALLVDGELGVLTAMPRMDMPTFGTRLLVPFPAFAVSTVQPRLLAYHTRIGLLGAVNGQFGLYTREAYDRLGGHEAVRGDAVEDLALGRRATTLGIPVRLEDATDRLTVRMYDTFGEAWGGFAKNLHALAGPWPLSLLAWLAVLATTLAGPVWLAISLATGGGVPTGAAVSVGLMLALWIGVARYCRLPWSVVPLGWLVLVVCAADGLWSIVLRLRGGATWKGRRLPS